MNNRDRWFRCLDISSIKVFEKGAWTPEEDSKLTSAMQKIGTGMQLLHWYVLDPINSVVIDGWTFWIQHCTDSTEEE